MEVSIPQWFDSNVYHLYAGDTLRNVSIPQWFDSNTCTKGNRRHHSQSLNSTMVRFKCPSLIPNQQWFLSLNSTMVRFKFCWTSYSLWISRVSIPQWFDSNDPHSRITNNRFMVSIPQWFDSNWSKGKRRNSAYFVSIPQWFDSNQTNPVLLTSAEKVSIPQWFDSNFESILFKHLVKVCLNSTMVRFKSANESIFKPLCKVSIPQWFDSNGRLLLQHQYILLSQFHNGSIQINFS